MPWEFWELRYADMHWHRDNDSSQLLSLHLLLMHLQAQRIMEIFVLISSFKRKIFDRNTAFVHDNKSHRTLHPGSYKL